MSRFKYSQDEFDINRVLKMNQDKSKEMISDSEISSLRNSADSNIEASLNLLKAIGKEKDCNSLTENISHKPKNAFEHLPQLEEWEMIVEQARICNPSPIVLEDIMSEDEIQFSIQEYKEIEDRFSKKSGIINKTDLSFLVIATALQVVKTIVFPYVAEKFEYGKNFDPSQRLAHNDKSIEKTHRSANDKFRDKNLKHHETGHWINLLYQTVPYDITKGSRNLGIDMGGRYHRMYTLGHDPILGWIFGTANILTDCITFNNFQTNRISRIDPIIGSNKMFITPEKVPLGQMMYECYYAINEDFLNLPAALFAQAQHLKSDEYTKLGLPVPLLSSFNEEFASKLYSENYDALCFARDAKIVGVSFFVSKFLDIIISLTHGLFKSENDNKDLYEIRTRKILLISNSIASTSTIINASITKNLKKLDIGTLLNTISHLFTDLRFIARIKQEFIESEISKKLTSEIVKLDSLYNSF